MSFRVVLVTTPPASAQRLARAIVTAKLAACVNVVPGLTSHYRWKGKNERARESLLICKTRAALLKKLEHFVKKNHPYAVPEIAAVPIVFGHKPYFAWVAAETR